MVSTVEQEATAREENNVALIAAIRRDRDTTETGSFFDFDLTNDAERGRWSASISGNTIAELSYRYVDGRIVLIYAWVERIYRGHKVASELIARVLDEIRRDGKKITIICPVVGEFIADHPEYSDLIDAGHPGSGAHPRPGDERNAPYDELKAFTHDIA